MTSIVFDKVSFGYSDEFPIFKDLSIRLEGNSSGSEGRLIAIMGPSGSGKTTLLRLVADVEIPGCGSLTISPPSANVAYVQQEPVLFEHLSRKENARYFTLVQRTRRQFDEATFQRLSDKLKLRKVLESRATTDEMSGGERQRLSLLRALSVRPKIILLDEPCTGLDVNVKLEFLHMLREVVDDLGLLALYVTHHADEAALVADALLYLTANDVHSGVMTNLSPIQEFFDRPPSVEAAQSTMTPGANLLSCTIYESGQAVCAGSVLGKISSIALAPGSYLLVFEPSSVAWNERGTHNVEVVGRSGSYLFAKAFGNEKLIGPWVQFQPRAVCLHGSVVAFRDGKGRGIRTFIAGDLELSQGR